MPVLSKKQQKKADAGKKAKTKEKEKSPAKRPAIYSQVKSEIRDEANPITLDAAKELLGFREETEKEPFGNKCLPIKLNGVKIRCDNNITNRPLYLVQIETLKQDILRKRWMFNGEPIIIGRTGLVLNGQHTLLALIWAVQEWLDNPSEAPAWEEEPVIHKMIVYGVPEDDETVNTMDTCKPRSLADVIYRAHYFKDLLPAGQKVAAKLAEKAIKTVWEKTGDSNAWVKRTHSESVAFLEQHRKLLDAVRHIFEEEGSEGKVAKYLHPGVAAAVLYLMATSKTEPKAYYGVDTPNESCLDFSLWDQACKFFVELAGGAESLRAVRDTIGKLTRDGGGKLTERLAVVAKAWVPYSKNKPVTAKLTMLRFEIKDDERYLDKRDIPLFGGIDVGEDGLTFATNGDPSKQEIAAKAEKVRAKRDVPKFTASKKGEKWAKGDKAWVHSKNDAAYPATLKDHPFPTTEGIEKVFVEAEDGEWEVAVMDLSLKEFEMA